MEIIKVETVEEGVAELKKYLKKLSSILEAEVKFSFIDAKLYDKKRLDDVMCCIESSWPAEYKNYIIKCGQKNLKSPICYKQLIKAVRNKFLFSTNHYSVNYSVALKALQNLLIVIEQDIQYILKNSCN